MMVLSKKHHFLHENNESVQKRDSVHNESVQNGDSVHNDSESVKKGVFVHIHQN